MSRWAPPAHSAPCSAKAYREDDADHSSFGRGKGHFPALGDNRGPLIVKPSTDDGPLTVSAFASANSFGIDTIATVNIQVRLFDRGALTLAFGSAGVVASASSPLGNSPFATAEAGFSVTGADLLVTRTVNTSGTGETVDRSWALQTSSASFVALDINGFHLGGNPILLTSALDKTILAPPPPPAGNTAVAVAVAEAFGDNTFTETATDTSAFENQLSNADAVAFATAAPTVADSNDDTFVIGSGRHDRINLGAGDDLIFGRDGNDTIQAGNGENTVFGNAGKDQIHAGNGNDWLFGGKDNDQLYLGGGSNIGYGGDGNDLIHGGSGADAISGGDGNDSISAGDGDNSLLLGSAGWHDDGDDRFAAGTGADWYFVAGAFGSDVISGFRIAEGDRIVISNGAWDTDIGLQALNGTTITLHRSKNDQDDLLITLKADGARSTLLMEEFFRLNAGYGDTPRRGTLTDEQALPILHNLILDGDSDAAALTRADTFLIGDTLSMFA